MTDRPDPDRLLKQVQADEARAHQGRLKLFFGASPGVGKTYAMLEAARQRKKEGWDVVVGIVETHKRVETEALLDGLEVLPRKDVAYKNVQLKEFDLDAALARRSRLILIDELAHTNAPGMRHAKRWQDVEEILDAGIDVYTTLNVQHWETLNDVVAQITGVVVRETVPDTFLRRAHELELVDLPPEDLLTRLKAGKVYQGELAGRAAENFFQPGNLIALRELALRHAAERVDAQMQAYKERNAVGDVWHVGDRLLVGVSGSPVSARLIRAASRMATRLRVPWIAVHIESSRQLDRGGEERARASNNLRMAEKLGAETVTLNGNNISEELVAYARSRNVTQIILGKPADPRWKEWLRGSIVSEVARRCGNIDLHVISGVGSELADRRWPDDEAPVEWLKLAQGAAVVGLTTLLCWPLSRFLDRANIVMVYLLGVALVAYRIGRRPALLASILGVLAFDFFFVPPYFTFAVTDTQYVVTFAIMLGVGLLIGTLAGRMRQQTEALRERADRLRALYRMSRDLSETPDTRLMLESARRQLADYYRRPVILLTPDAAGNLAVGSGDTAAFGWNENELSVARWVFDREQMAGAGSDTLSGAAGLYLPMKGIRKTVGVFGIRPDDNRRLLDTEELRLLEAFVSEIGGALESTRMSEEIGRGEMQMERQAMEQSSPASVTGLAGVLTVERILRIKTEMNRNEIIHALLERLKPPSFKAALKAVLDREKAGATVIGDLVSVPHARVEGLTEIQAALAVTDQGPVKVWILFLTPTADPRAHLAFLANVAAFFRNPAHAEALRTIETPAAILDYVRNHQPSSVSA